MADKALSTKKFEFQRPSSNNIPTPGASSSEDKQRPETSSSSRPGIPTLGLRPIPPTTPPASSYASGSQTQRNAGRVAARQTDHGENVLSTASIGDAVIVNTSASGMTATTANSTTATTANSTVTDSTRFPVDHDSLGGNIGDRRAPSSVMTIAKNLQLKFPVNTPRAMPPLPLPSSGNKAEQPATLNPAPPPPLDVPSSPVIKPGSMSTPRQPSTTRPFFLEELASPRSTEAGFGIRQIAADIVAAEVENGLDLKQIGRLSPKLDGVSVYSRLAAHVNREMANSGFMGVVEGCRQAVMKKFGKTPEKLTVVEGSTTERAGEHTGVDLDRIAVYTAPIFDFVCGAGERVADCNLPKGLLSLFKAVDRELLASLLARREQQLTAQKLGSSSLSPEILAKKLEELGWTDTQFKKLASEAVFTAVRIHAFRINMFTGLLFTRCISPFILYNSDELQQESSKRTASPAKPLVKLAEGANKLFKKNHAEFVEDFIRDSNSVLPEESALALVTISSGEERFSKVKKSKKSLSNSKAYSRSPGRHSAPVLPQGGDFKKLMEDERKAADAEASSTAPRRAPVDYKIRRDAAIDKFKSSHATDFGDEDFAIAFSLVLREWKRDNREIDMAAVPLAMKQLHRQVKKSLADREKLERDGPPVQSPSGKGRTGGIQTSPHPASASSSTTTSGISPILSPGKHLVDQERLALLNKFLKKNERRTSLERYPDLRKRVEAEVTAWVEQQSGGSFGLALKKIFEQELVKSFNQSGRIISDAPLNSLKELKEAVRSWKERNPGEILTLDVLWQIAPKSFEPLTLDRTKKNAQFLYKEFLTEVFLQRDEVFAELRGNKRLKKNFLHDVRHWILDGGYSQNPETAVQQFYHDALTGHYQEGLATAGAQAVHIRSLTIAAMKWWEDNEASVLTTAVLQTLYAAIKTGE